jgi:hypothetical protein
VPTIRSDILFASLWQKEKMVCQSRSIGRSNETTREKKPRVIVLILPT